MVACHTKDLCTDVAFLYSLRFWTLHFVVVMLLNSLLQAESWYTIRHIPDCNICCTQIGFLLLFRKLPVKI